MKKKSEIEPTETDRLGLGKLRIRQKQGFFKFTIDPILLASFCRIYPKEKVLDLGTGGGVVPLWLAGYRGVLQVTGLEFQAELAVLAVENVFLNGLEERVEIIQGDLRVPGTEVTSSSYNWVLSNPPYIKPSAGSLMENPVLAQAKFELTCTLEDVIKSAARLTPHNGRLALVHLPERLSEIMVLMDHYGFEPKRMVLVHPKPGQIPHRVLIEGRKSARPGLFLLKPFYIHKENGEFTDEMIRVYQGDLIPEK